MSNSFIPYGADPGVVGRRTATRKVSETRDAVTADFHRDEIIVAEPKIVTFQGFGATFRIPGVASSPHNLWSLENLTGSGIVVAIHELRVWSTLTAANVALVTPALFRIATVPTGGTQFTKTSADSRHAASNASVIIRGAASADGTASAITATAAGQRLTSGFHTMSVGAVYSIPPIPVAMVRPNRPFLCHPGQAYLLQNITNSLTTNHYVVEVGWEEYTEY